MEILLGPNRRSFLGSASQLNAGEPLTLPGKLTAENLPGCLHF